MVKRYFATSLSVEKLRRPLVFKDINSGMEHIPYLFISKPSNTFSLYCDIDQVEAMELNNFFEGDSCGYVNIDGQGVVDMESAAWEYSRRVRN